MHYYPTLIFAFVLLLFYSNSYIPQNKMDYLTNKEIGEDLAYLNEILQNKSSYQGLNGYNYQEDFKRYLADLEETKTTKKDFGLFLSKTIGKIGDRHSYIKGYGLPESLYLPISFAPYKNKVIVLQQNNRTKEYAFWNSDFPYLKSINHLNIDQFLSQILPKDRLAPPQSYLLHSIRELRDIETVFSIINKVLPKPLPIQLMNEQGLEKELLVPLVTKKQRAKLWDERYHKKNFFFRLYKEQRNKKTILASFFSLENDIGYIQIPSMVDKENSPVFFDLLNNFMKKATNSKALIVDVRDNGGGTRDLIQELAGYFIPADSIYVVNAVRQRGILPINEALKKDLHNRYLFAKNEINIREKNAVEKFMTTFSPMYDLDDKKFSDYHFYIFDGKKLSQNKFHYNKPIYVLANERSFSAASVLVSVFKGLPNIQIVGVNTDGSSGNSYRFKLPNSGFQGKISTMVSFQKDGQILDGIGTKPDIEIERSLNQIFFKEDYQLNKLKEIIK